MFVGIRAQKFREQNASIARGVHGPETELEASACQQQMHERHNSCEGKNNATVAYRSLFFTAGICMLAHGTQLGFHGDVDCLWLVLAGVILLLRLVMPIESNLGGSRFS